MMKYGQNLNVLFATKRKFVHQKSFEFKKFMLDEDFSREEFMNKFPTARTFPQILIDGRLVGGYTEFAAEVGIE